MHPPCALVTGDSSTGLAVAMSLAEAGWEVLLADPAHDGAQAATRSAMRGAGSLEVRTDARLVGYFDLTTHVEAEFSDGRVENFDLVILPYRQGGHGDADGRLVHIPAGLGERPDELLGWTRGVASRRAPSRPAARVQEG